MAIFDIFRKKKKDTKRRLQKDDSKPITEKTTMKEISKEEPEIAKKKSLKESSIAPKVLIEPHITEKATMLSEKGVYVFKISPVSNKIMVSQAIKELYGVKPKRVRIINLPAKKRVLRGHEGIKSGYKKAMVYLNKGDKIEL